MSMTGVFPRSNYVVTARFVIRPDFVSKMRVITHDLTSASRAENGCILCHFAESTEKEGVFFLIMIWRDEASYRQYAASDYVRAFTSNLSAGMLEKPQVIEKWRSLG
jgi:quinol monooxygenase YgiN